MDDESFTARTEEIRIKKHGFAVKILNSGTESIEYLDNNDHIDLILMDIKLNEELDGIEIAKKYKLSMIYQSYF